MFKQIIDILTNESFIGAILISLSFIIIGFILRKKEIINGSGKSFLTFLVLKISLPAMALVAFMNDFDSLRFKENILVFIVSLLLYIIFIAVCQLCLFKQDKNKRKVVAILMVVGQLTFFALPILKTIYDAKVLISVNMMTLAFRIILYIYCYLTISKLKWSKTEMKKTLKNVFLNPVMIAMAIGMIIWFTQNISFLQVSINNSHYSIFRIDQTLPSVYTVFKTASDLNTPLAMLIIGCILGEANISYAFKDKMAWLISLFKTLIIPLLALGIVILLQSIKIIHFNQYDLAVIVLGFGAPLSAVVSTYCSKYDNEAELGSRVCFLSTIMCLLTYPLLFVVMNLCLKMPIFS